MNEESGSKEGEPIAHWDLDETHGMSERKGVLLCGACFFFLMFGYFLLRPLREAMGVERSMGDLKILFLVTCAVSLVCSIAFGGLVSKVDRSKFIPIAYRVVMGCLGIFVILLSMDLGEKTQLFIGYVFYVWLSVVNLFMVSVFWGLMADVWSLDQAKRIFVSIGIGGSLGALLSSNFTWWLAEKLGPIVQMLIAIVMFECAVRCVSIIRKRVGVQKGTPKKENTTNRIGGSWIDGVKACLRSRYILGIGGYIFLLAIGNTLIYFTGSDLVSREKEALIERVALFAQLDMWTQLATLLVQLFVTGHLIRKLGIGIAMVLLPLITIIGFVILSVVSQKDGVEGWVVFGVFATFSAVHRATRYAIVRPARESLFSVLPESEKYKAKPIIDVFFYRGGDAIGAFILVGTLGAMMMLVAPLAMIWGGLAIGLAIHQSKRAELEQSGNHSMSDEAGSAGKLNEARPTS